MINNFIFDYQSTSRPNIFVTFSYITFKYYLYIYIFTPVVYF